MFDDTIVAVSTPIGEGGIGIVRVSGPGAIRIADRIFVSPEGKKPSEFVTHTIHYGHVVDIGPMNPKSKASITSDRRIVDEVLLTVMRAPRTYTRDDIVEINCHGGIEALKEVMELIVKHGARVSQPGEFTKRAFLSGRIDLSQAEAVLDMIRAKTEGSLKAAMSQLEGRLSERVEAIRMSIIDVTSEIEASIDFPEEDLGEPGAETSHKVDIIISDISHLIDTADEGIILREGISAVICGKPNAGKSSLMNLLLKRDRVIVTPIPGTTRDAVEEMINLKGIPIRLIDTAGIGYTKDAIEKEGIRRSKDYLRLADLVLLVLDSSTGLGQEDTDIIKMIEGKKKLVIINKIDLASEPDRKVLKEFFKKDTVVEISVEKKRNIDVLEKTIEAMVWKGDLLQNEGALVANIRHKELLDRALVNMKAVRGLLQDRSGPEVITLDLKEAIFSLGLITGKSVSDDILDRIFEQFCIGK